MEEILLLNNKGEIKMIKKLCSSFIFSFILLITLNNPASANSEQNNINPAYIEVFEKMSENLDTIRVINPENIDITDDFIENFSNFYKLEDFQSLYEYFSANVGELTYLNNDDSESFLASTSRQATYVRNIQRLNEKFVYSRGSIEFSWLDTLTVKYTYNTSTGQILSIDDNSVISDIWHPNYSFQIKASYSHGKTPSNSVSINNSYTMTPVYRDEWGQHELFNTRTFTVTGTVNNPVIN
ncbi:hypothetical protein [Bacillus sp. FJAT-29937]|uniref:hypothetical protein n=1 Tax=Bacillus sp. FJAT-29937 TaxID=1720553 RepID=UPI00082F721F|nr:hypothetical protein [Bacillus sp. FJAT-29937]